MILDIGNLKGSTKEEIVRNKLLNEKLQNIRSIYKFHLFFYTPATNNLNVICSLYNSIRMNKMLEIHLMKEM
jgi:hypothetical protein